jgi:carbon-monoxide dehydrogenase medium subunit
MAGKKCKDARIAMGSVGPTPLRCARAEEMLKGKSPDKALITQCSSEAMAACNPVDDQRATAWYRRQAGTALVARALAQAAGLAEE